MRRTYERDDPRYGIQERPLREWFSRFARRVSDLTGRPWAFALAFAIVLVWGLSGPIFRFTDTWQLVINTGTTIVTFLMVFLVQHTQNRDTAVLQIKLDELLRAQKRAHNYLIDLEDLSEAEIERLRVKFQELAQRERAEEGEPQLRPERPAPRDRHAT